jgi:hypothetical protein
MTPMRELFQFTDGLQDFLAKTPSRGRIVVGDELPNFGDVLRCPRVKVKARIGHFERLLL